MTVRPTKTFTARPRSAEAWVSVGKAEQTTPPSRGANTARLTVDVTPELRKRIKFAALQRGLTLADLLRAMLAEAFPEEDQERAP